MAKLRKIAANTAVGAASGGAAAGPAGAAVGGAFGLVNSFFENGAQKAADKRSRKWQDEQATKQFNRQKYFDSLEKRWNSEQSQVQRFKDAGLNPNLMYGDLSASTASTPQVPLPSTPNGVTRDFSVDSSALQGAQTGIDSVLKAAQTDNLNQNTAKTFQDTISADIENRYKETGIVQTLMEQIERINKLRADIEKTGADTKTVDALRDSLVEQLSAEIALNKQRVEESKQNVEKSQQDVKESKSRVDVNKQNIKESNQRIDESKQNINESKSRERLNNSNRVFKDVETKDLVRKYSIDMNQYRMIHDFVKKHDLPAGSEKSIIDALNRFAESTGTTIPKVTGEVIESWLDGGNWLNYLVGSERNEVQREGNQLNYEANEHRTDAIKQGYQNQTEDETPQQRQGNKHQSEFDRAYTPQQKEYIRESRIYYQYLNQDMRQEYEKQVSKNPKMLQIEKAQLTRKLYYQQYGTNKLPDNE